MATGCPASAPSEKGSMIAATDDNDSRGSLLLEMALETKRLVAFSQHFLIHGPMNFVACRASFPHGLMFKHEWSALRDMTFATRIALRRRREHPAVNGIALMWIVAIGTRHLAFQDGMTIRQIELPSLIEMALKTDFRRFSRINDRVVSAARLIVAAASTVTGFAPDLMGMNAIRLDLRMSCGFEVARDSRMALLAALGPSECGAGNLRR
jgi:hypothetical protein